MEAWCTSTYAARSCTSTLKPAPSLPDGKRAGVDRKTPGIARRFSFCSQPWSVRRHKQKSPAIAGHSFSRLVSASAVGDATFAQIVGGQFYANLVTGQDPDVVLAHLSGDVRSNDVPIFQLHAKHGVGQGVDDSTFHFEAVFFRHSVKPSISND